jgi:hypothetical protein
MPSVKSTFEIIDIGTNTKMREFITMKNPVGRPTKFDMRIANKLADTVAHNYPISDACRYARISRSTYYYYLNNEPLFAKKMSHAHENKNKVSFNFRTIK